jgi:hypothetical protein
MAGWAIDLKHPEENAVHCYQLRYSLEDAISSPWRNDHST